jgi:hypothetical protein
VAVSDDVVGAMRAYLGALHASTGDAFDESDRQFRAQLILVAALTIDYTDTELDVLMNDAKKATG